MVYAYTWDSQLDEETYFRITENVGPEPLDGLLAHVCFRKPGGGLHVVEIWESEDAERRGTEERVVPAVRAAFGGALPGDPPARSDDVVHVTGSLTTAPAN